MDAMRNLKQPTTWSPLDLTDENVPSLADAANEAGPGILPDLTDSRPELRPVAAPASGAPATPWEG